MVKVNVDVDVTTTTVVVAESSLLALGAALGDQVVSRDLEGALGMWGSEDVKGLGLDAGVVGSSLVVGVGSWSAVTTPSRTLGLLGIAIEDVLVVVGPVTVS